MSDTPTAGTGAAQAATQSKQGNTATGAVPSASAPDQQLAAALEANRTLQERYENAQKLIGRQGQELNRLRTTATQSSGESYDYGYDDSRAPVAEDPTRQVLKEIVAQQDLLRYRQEVPDWAQFQPDVDRIVNDQARVYEVIAWKPDGFGGVMPDWNRTYRNAKMQVELERYRNAQATASQSQQQATEQRDALRGMATLSGSVAVPQDREITMADLKGKSAAEIAEIARAAGLVPSNDPPTFPKR